MDRRALGRPPGDRRGRRATARSSGSRRSRRTGPARRTRRRSRTRSTCTATAAARASARCCSPSCVRLARGARLPLGRSPASSAATTRRSRCTTACGFELVGVEREVGRKFGRWLDVVLMQTDALMHDVARAPERVGQWAGLDSNQRSVTQRVYSPSPLATRVPTRSLQLAGRLRFALLREEARHAELRRRLRGRPARGPQRGRPGESRDLATRFDFKGTDSTVELKDNAIELDVRDARNG